MVYTPAFKPEDPHHHLYTFKSQLGKQFNARKQSAPEWSIGTAYRDVDLPLLPSSTPGPASYSADGAPLAVYPPYKTCLKWGASTTPRNSTLPAYLAPPGPERYTTCTAHMIGRVHPITGMRTAPHHSWTSLATREARGNAYVSRGHERENYGKHSPGPHAVGREAFSSVGRQASSPRRTQPRFAQVNEKRFFTPKAADTSRTPGPGSYDV